MNRSPVKIGKRKKCEACHIRIENGLTEQSLYERDNVLIVFRDVGGTIERQTRMKLLVCRSCADRIDEGTAITRPSKGPGEDLDAA